MSKSSQKNTATEIVDGRECKRLDLKNGDKVYIIDKFKGREFRHIRPLLANMFQINVDPDNIKEDMTATLKAGGMIEAAIATFPILGLKIVRPDGQELKATMQYFDELEEYEDMELIYAHLEGILTSGSFKKKLGVSKKV